MRSFLYLCVKTVDKESDELYNYSNICINIPHMHRRCGKGEG